MGGSLGELGTDIRSQVHGHLVGVMDDVVPYRARQLYKNISMLFLFPVTRDLLFTNIIID